MHVCQRPYSVCTQQQVENLRLCNSAGITSQIFSSTDGEKCISMSGPEQELATRLSVSIMSPLFLMLKDYLFIMYFLLAYTSDNCAFKYST